MAKKPSNAPPEATIDAAMEADVREAIGGQLDLAISAGIRPSSQMIAEVVVVAIDVVREKLGISFDDLMDAVETAYEARQSKAKK